MKSEEYQVAYQAGVAAERARLLAPSPCGHANRYQIEAGGISHCYVCLLNMATENFKDAARRREELRAREAALQQTIAALREALQRTERAAMTILNRVPVRDLDEITEHNRVLLAASAPVERASEAKPQAAAESEKEQ